MDQGKPYREKWSLGTWVFMTIFSVVIFWFFLGQAIWERVSPSYHRYKVAYCLENTPWLEHETPAEHAQMLRSCHHYARILIFF
jgi:hypothetical protein